MKEKVIIYGKAGWPFTTNARSAYRNAVYVDVREEAGKLEEMLKLSDGARKVPVIVEGDNVKIGYGGSWGVYYPIVDGIW